MNRLTRALEQLPLRHRPRGPEAVLASARHAAQRDRARRRAVVGGGLAAAMLATAGLGVWAAAGDDATQVETGPLDAPTPAPAPTTEPVPDTTDPAPTTATTTTSTTAPVGGAAPDGPVVVHFAPDDGGGSCTAVTEVQRVVSGPAVLQAALEAQLAGPTPAEAEAGLTSWFSSDTAGMLASASIENGTAHVDFDGALPAAMPGANTACGRSSLLTQLDRTIRQFSTVGRVIFSIDGSIEGFYAWLEMDAPELAPQWGGVLQEVWPTGQLQAPGFTDHVRTEFPSWGSDPREAAMVLVGLPSLTEPVDVDIAHGAIDGGRTVVTITQSGFRDDSVHAMQHRIVFEQDQDGGPVRFVEGTISTRCQPGRGHQDFQTALCP